MELKTNTPVGRKFLFEKIKFKFLHDMQHDFIRQRLGSSFMPDKLQSRKKKFFLFFWFKDLTIPLNKWMYTLQYHHFLAADCCWVLYQLKSFYQVSNAMVWLIPDWVVSCFFSLFFPIQGLTSFSDSRSPGFTCDHIQCASLFGSNYLTLKIVLIRHCWQIAST